MKLQKLRSYFAGILLVGLMGSASAQSNLDAGIVQLNSPLAPHASTTKSVQVRLRNVGNLAITKVKLGWSVNGVAQTDVTAVIAIPVATNANQIPVGNVTLSTTYIDAPNASLLIFIKEINDQSDANALNDTFRVTFGSPISGNKVIGIAPSDYRDFTSAVNDMRHNGISGDLTFKVKPGTYNDKIELIATELNYTVPNRSMIFESQSGNRDVILVSESPLQATVRINGVDRVTLKNLRIVNRNIVSGIGVHMFGAADRNTVDNCEITVDSISNGPGFAGVLLSTMGGAPGYALGSAAAAKFATITNCKISGGYYGIAHQGAAVPRDTGIVIDKNTISQVSFFGVHVNQSNNAKIRQNKVDFRPSANLKSTGYLLQNITTTAPGNIEITRNYVVNAGQLGMSLNAVTGTGTPTNRYVNIYNNMIAGGFFSNRTTAADLPRGLLVVNSGWLNIYFNSILMDAPTPIGTTDNTASFHFTGASATGLVRVYNNNFVNARAGYAYFNNSATATNPITQSNNNNIWVANHDSLSNPTTGFAWWNGAPRIDLSELILSSTRDQSSLSKDPSYFSTSDLHTLSTDLNQRGSTIPLTESPIDYDGELRDQVNPPDIGCDEFGPGGEDFAIIGITPDVFKFNKPTPWNITVRYQGNTNGNKRLFFLYKINGADQLDPDSAIEFQFTQLSTYFRTQTFQVPANRWITRPTYQSFKMTVYIYAGNIGDLRQFNDSIVVDVCVGLEGIFTIDPTIAPSVSNFTSFTEIYDYLKCGVAGPTVFRIQDGVYDEQINLWKIRNSSATNTITFQAKNSALATRLTYINGTSENHATILFNNAQYIILKDLTIENRSLANGSCIQLAGNSRFNKITECFIRVDSTITPFPTTLIPIVSSKLGTLLNVPTNYGINSQDNIIERNTISGGIYGIGMFGQDTAQRDKGNIIQDNKIVSFHKAGVYLDFADTRVLHNVIAGKFGMDNSAWGIFAKGLGDRAGVDENLISGNKIYDITFQGIMLQSCLGKKNPGAKKSSFTLSNNMIGGGFTTLGTTTSGINLNSCVGISILHNTVLMDAPRTSSTTASESVARCIIVGSTNSACEAINNVFYSTNGAIAMEYYTRIRNQGSPNTGLSLSESNLYYTTYASKNSPLILIQRLSNNTVTKNNYQFSQLSQSSATALSNFKAGNGNGSRDRKSLAQPVKFEKLPYDLHSYDLVIESKATGGMDVNTDVDKEPRKARNTDMGCDEFTVPNYDLDIYQVLNPLLCYTKPNTIAVQMRNRGKYSLDGFKVVLEYKMQDGEGGFTFTSMDTVTLTMRKTGDLQDYFFKTKCSVPAKGFYNLCIKLKSGLTQDTVYTNNEKCKELCTGIEGDFYIGFNSVLPAEPDTLRYFSKIQQAVTFVTENCGICDETYFNINPGNSPYVERITIPKYLVNLDSPLVTFRPYNTTQNSAVVVQQPVTPAGDADKLHYTLRLFGSNFVRIQNLTIQHTGTTFGSGVHITRNAQNNIIEGCRIAVNNTSANPLFYPIAFTSSNKLNILDNNSFAKNGSNNRIVRNELSGGFASIAMLGASVVDFDFGNVLDSNIMTDYHQFGVYSANNTVKSISFNSLTPRLASAATCVSISYNFGAEGGLINANKIINSKQIGIKVYGVDGFIDNRLIISNNWITNDFSNSTADTSAAILVKRSNNIGIFYNSIRYNGFVAALSIQRDSATVATPEGPVKIFFTPFNIQVRNNIFMTDSLPAAPRKPYVIYFNSTDPTSEFENNNHFSGYPSRFAFFPPNNQNTFAIWRQNTAKDLSSFNLEPNFVSGFDLNLTPGDTLRFDKKARPVKGITRDYYNRKRSPRVTDIGSIEYEKENRNVSLFKIVNEKANYGSNTFSVVILNEGNADLSANSICLQYSIDSGKTWSTSENVQLAQLKGRYDEQIYNFNVKYQKNDFLVIPLCVRIAPTCRLTSDTITQFESICKELCVGLEKGNYTIGKNGTEDFSTFQEAVVALVCGFDSSIVFQVSPGLYRERFTIPPIATSFDTTVTFISSTKNADDVVIQYENTSEDLDHHIAQLDGSSHIAFKYLTFKSNAKARSSGIHLADSASYNLVENCVFQFDSTAAANTLVGVLGSGKIAYTDLATTNNNLVRHCTFIGGGFGVRFLNQKSAATSGPNQVTQSTFRGQLTAAIDIFYSQTDSLAYNDIIMRNGNNNSVGINVYGALTDFIILGNKIVNAQNIGLKIDSCRTISRGLIANNMIAGGFISDGENGDYGMYIANTGAFPAEGITSSGSIDILSNSVLYDGANDTAAAFRIYRANGMNILNNIFANIGDGYAVSFTSSNNGVTEFIESGNNLLYRQGPYIANWRDTLCVDLTHLGIQDQGNSPFNVGKSPKGLGEFNPGFRSNTDLHVNNTSLDGAATPMDLITKDIDGETRNPSSPDVGCDEYFPSFDANMFAFITPQNNDKFKDSAAVAVFIRNAGADLNQLKIKYTMDGVIVDSLVRIFSPVFKIDSILRVDFPKKFTTRQGGPHVICAYTEIKKLLPNGQFVNNDFNTFNDTLCVDVISLDTSDIGVSRFIEPLNGLPVLAKTPVRVQVSNYGNLTAFNYRVELKVNGKVKERKTITNPLFKDEVEDVSFNYQLDPDSAVNFEICVRTLLFDDVIEANDSNCIVVPTTGVGIGNQYVESIEVFPNPTTGRLNYKFEIANEESIQISVFDLSGRLVQSDQFDNLPAGTHLLPIYYDQLAEGTYLFQTQMGDKRVNGRFIIIK